VSASLPEGYVDPTDPVAVAAVLQATVDTGGLDAVSDLLARLPGTRQTPAVPRGFRRAAAPAAIWLGAETCWSCTAPPTLLHVVGGVVLHHETVEAGEVAVALSRVVADLVRRIGAVADASAALTAARDLAAGG
jgi:hypothetical protein